MTQEEFQEQALAELREITSWYRFQRKLLRWTWLFLALPLLLIFVMPVWVNSKTKNLTGTVGGTDTSWYEVDSDYRSGRFDEALRKIDSLLQVMPNYARGHQLKGAIYLMKGDLRKSEANYARAAELWPSKAHKDDLEAIRERIAKTK